jgi:hypothetical protein
MTQEALKLALEALENLEHSNFKRRRLDALIGIKQVLAQPPLPVQDWKTLPKEAPPLVKWATEQTPPLPVQPEERNFCPRCGKRTADPTTIHTCTPPMENT